MLPAQLPEMPLHLTVAIRDTADLQLADGVHAMKAKRETADLQLADGVHAVPVHQREVALAPAQQPEAAAACEVQGVRPQLPQAQVEHLAPRPLLHLCSGTMRPRSHTHSGLGEKLAPATACFSSRLRATGGPALLMPASCCLGHTLHRGTHSCYACMSEALAWHTFGLREPRLCLSAVRI